MARKIILKENGLSGSGNAPTGYRYLGYNGTTTSEKFGATVSAIGGGGSSYLYTEVSVSSSQILNMATSPVTLLPSLPVGQYYMLEKIALEYTAGGSAYQHVTDDSVCIYQDNEYAALIWKNFLAQSSGTRVVYVNDFTAFADNVFTDLKDRYTSGLQNGSVVLSTYNQTGNYTNGNGTILVKIWYEVKSFGTEL